VQQKVLPKRFPKPTNALQTAYLSALLKCKS
jgi:hypothetical protein